MSRRFWVLALGIAGAISAAAQGVTPAEHAADLESFEKVWKTVRDKHWDPKPNGIDWQAVHDELRERAATYKQRLSLLLGKEVAEFNAMLRQKEVPNIVTTAGNE